MSIVIGLSLGHDGAIALVKDGRLVAAIARERVSRVKKQTGVSRAELDYVLDFAGVGMADITAVAFAAYHYAPDNYIKLYLPDGQEVTHHLFDHPSGVFTQQLQTQIDGRRVPAIFVQHHLSHCASTFYTSPFERAACFSLDSSMLRPEACSIFAYGSELEVHPLYCPGLMIGNAYNIFTSKLGLGDGLFKAGTTMGLASYGQILPMARENWQRYGQSYYARAFQENDFIFIDQMWSELSGLPPHQGFSKEQSDKQPAMDIAASLQFVFEETIVQAAQALYDKTKNFSDGNLCLSGGSFLNCNTNSAILDRTEFANVHLFPGCGDDGTAVGAALYVAHHLMKAPRRPYEPEEIAYLGRSYPETELGEPLNFDVVIETIADGGVVGWFQGRSEFGPRALGNRSILADPRNPGMRDHINNNVKRREWFRPFAPMVMEEHVAEWFEFDRPSPFMLFTAAVREPDRLPAISHVDGSARIQTVSPTSNPRIYELLKRFKAVTGVPVLLNTSLNVNSEPLVETPEDALRFWEGSPVSLMVIGDRMLRR